jgi:thiol-disulfide isomerase/thioredoxin
MKSKTTYFYIALIVIVVGGIIAARYFSIKTVAPTAYDTFAQCLTDKGAKFYGAFWCPHCQEQKKLLQHSAKLPYVECSTPDGNSQTQVCIDEQVHSYPTWKFSDGTVLTGVQQLSTLSDKTGCSLPSTSS